MKVLFGMCDLLERRGRVRGEGEGKRGRERRGGQGLCTLSFRYIMTSDYTKEPTQQFFEKNK